ncbi:DNA-binding transcriptional LysR family regulator [Rhizobium petrolearium]|uniref:LysR family transcriptional regulator n=1 Tax=Neorhizobium petrolearium TaxID=515361 RepID=UPI001AE5C5C4|nr:LysR family transcriptional regulator [Neorhizobium petrolearium]MBP1844908.1 DNA-binding transcriptional LysR family regulator [Neorhizobium petrolearium]
MTLDVRSAQIMLECARRGSLGAAANALNMTQPAITRMLKRLEDSYGVPLFERTTRGVVPTVFGDALLPYAKLVVSEIGNASDVIQQMQGASRGVVRIGGVASVVSGFIITVIREMRKQHPEVQYQIIEDLEDRVLEALKGGTVDIAISPEPYLDDDIVIATPDILHDTVSVFARCDHPIVRRDHVTLEEAADFDWALPPPGTPTVREWQRRFHDNALEPNAPSIISRSVPVLKAAVLSESLFCWMPLPLVREEVERGEMARVNVPELDWQRTFRVYRRKKGLMTPPTANLLQAIRRISETWRGQVA